MIHIVVPNTQTLCERSDGVTKYTAFNLHINGWFHSSVRYSVLHKFSETIKMRFGGRYNLPPFPPKKFGRLKGEALDERRMLLAKYLQTLVQKPEIMRNSVVEKTFLDFQLDSYRPSSSCVSIDVYLGDGEKVHLRCNVSHSTKDVCMLLAEELKCEYEDLCEFFSLFMMQPRNEDDPSDLLPVRLLRNFESPYVSLQIVNQHSASQGVYSKLMLRRTVWDPRLEESALSLPVIPQLLYKQASTEFKCGLFVADRRVDELNAAIEDGNVDGFLRLCHQQSSYGYEFLGTFSGSTGLYSGSGSGTRKCTIRVGRRSVVLGYLDNDGKESGETGVYKATRIRTWRISQAQSVSDPPIFEFEYLVEKETFEWITLHTTQAILLSLLLQSIGSEILKEHRQAIQQPPLVPDDAHPQKEIQVRAVSPDYQTRARIETYESFQEVFAVPLESGFGRNETFLADITDDDL